jgi:hypothetical protein
MKSPNKYQKLILRFLKDTKYFKQTEWKRETALAKKLLLENSIDFWMSVSLPFELNSLAWFLTPEGKTHVAVTEKKLVLDLKKEATFSIIEEPKQSENTEVKKPQTILDFLKHGKT